MSVLVGQVLSTINRSDDNLEGFTPFETGFAKTAFSYYIKGQDSDVAGLTDLIVRGGKGTGIRPFEYNVDLQKVTGMETIIDPERHQYVEKKFTDMNRFIKGKTPVIRLLAYIWLARELELMHILPDANGRSTMVLLYQLVANDPDLPMIMFHNPNVLDANGPEKILYRMLENMEKFKNAGVWNEEGHQQSDDSLLIADLQLDDPVISKFRDQCIKEGRLTWEDFYALMTS